MHILFLTQIIPYPPDAGPRVKTWNVLRYLAEQGHQLTLASFVRPEEERHVGTVRQVCAQVHTIPLRRSRWADLAYGLRSQITGRPFLVERDDLSAMRNTVGRLLQDGSIDVLHADQLTMTQFALPLKNGPRPVTVFDAHNAVWTIVERMRQTAPLPLRPLLALEARRVKQYEGLVTRLFNHTLAVTEPDRQFLIQAMAAASPPPGARPAGTGRITVIPITIDTRALQPVHRQPGSMDILTMGTLHYPPNADGIRWFARQVFPLIRQLLPEATLTIVGKNPPQDFIQLAERQPGTIRVTGYVPDLTPYLEQAALTVVPVRAGSGMRVRILGAFARGIPVVTTTIGLEGIAAQPGKDVLVADTPEVFAAEVRRLLRNLDLQNRLAENGRRLAETRYDFQNVLPKLEEVYFTGLNEPL